MRSNLEDNQAFNQLFQSGRFSHSKKVLDGDAEITTNGSVVNFFDANGATRVASLPALEEGRFYIVGNIGVANDIEVRSANGQLITTLLPADVSLVVASDAEWLALRGWAALGVFTNTINGLVPAPNSAVPGSLFLRDDGQWAQVQVTGIVDAFKFITDGTNTAIGSGPDTFWLRSSTGQVDIEVTNGHVTFGDTADFTINEAAINHDLLLNFFPDEHVGHSTVTLTAGVGLSGGGDITASRTFNLDLNDLTSDTPVLADSFAFYDASGADTNKATLTVLNGILDHDALLNFVADEHVAHTGVSIIAGTGLSGGGDITTSRTLNLDLNDLTVDTIATGDFVAFYDISGADTNKITFANFNAALDHNSLLNYVANRHIDHTAVTLTAGAGLTGGGDISASRSFAVGAGTGITVNADDVALDTASSRNVDHSAVSISTTEGIQGGGTIAATRTLKLDINTLTADATPDSASDYVATWDASASLHKKVLLSNLPGGGGSSFAAGTAMLFVQTAAPTGWTKSVTHNDKALRVVSGTASSGGTNAFSTVMAQTTTGSHTLTLAQIPAHSHTYNDAMNGGTANVGAGTQGTVSGGTTNSQGGGGSHNHTITMGIQYVDVIIATKD